MRRKTVTVSGWAVAALVLMLLGGTAWAASQPTPFPSGAFVVASDGSYWVVGDGVRYPISFTTDAGDALSAVPKGNTAVASVCEASAALNGADIAATCHPSPPANPAETLLGQRMTMCSYGVPIELTVARAEWTKTVIGVDAPGNGMWAVLIFDVTNKGVKDESLYSFAKLRDERGREFKWASYPPDPIDLSRAYGVKGSFEKFSPGVTEQSIAAFVVPPDVQSLTLLDASLDPAPCR
jgi:hypothetical protein